MENALVTPRAVANATLGRQRLLEPADTDAASLVRATGPPQAQFALSPHLALRARSGRGLHAVVAELEAALRDRVLVKATLMRGTLHLLPAEAYPDVRAAVDRPLRRRFRQYAGWDPDENEVAGLRGALAEAADEPRTRGEIADRLRGKAAAALPDASAVSLAMRYLAPTVHAPESGFWEAPRRTRLASADAWLANQHANAVGDPDEGCRWLVRSHLTAYGPATVADIAQWSSLGVREVRRALADLGNEATRLVTDDGSELIDLAAAPRPCPDDGAAANAEAPVALLPWWDSLLLAYRDRRRILGDLDRTAVVRPNGDVQPTALVHGRVAATWHQEMVGDGIARLTVQPLTELDADERAAIHEAATALLGDLAPDVIGEVVLGRVR